MRRRARRGPRTVRPSASSSRSAAWRARRSASRQASVQRRSAASIDSASRSSQASAANNSGSTAIRRSAWPSGSGLRWSRSSTTSASARATSRWVARVVGVAPTCSTTSGRWLASHASSPITSWPAASARPASPGVETQSGQRFRQDGPSKERPERQQRQARGRVPGAERDHTPAARVARRGTRRARFAPRRRHGRAPAPSGATRRVQPDAPRASGTSGSSKGALTCTGPGGRAGRRVVRPRARVEPRLGILERARHRWLEVGARVPPVQLGLIDRLVRTRAAQPRRPVGRQHEQRHPCLRRLDDRGEVLRGRGAARARERDRRRRSPWQARARRRPRHARPDGRAHGSARRAPAPARAGSSGSPARRTRARTPRAGERVDQRRSRTRARRRRGPSRHRLRQHQARARAAGPSPRARVAVPTSTGIRSRPVAVREASSGLIASGHAARPNSPHCASPASGHTRYTRNPSDDRRRTRRSRAPRRGGAPARRPSAPRACACPPLRRWRCRARCSPPGSRRRAARRPRAHHHGVRGHRLDHHEARPARRHEPEEHEHHHLAEPEPGVGARAAAVQQRRDDRERADDQDQHRRRREREREPRERRDRRSRRTRRPAPPAATRRRVCVSRGGPTRSCVSTPFIPSNASLARLTPICSPAATTSAAPKRHQTTWPAAAVPTTTGISPAPSVRGRAPSHQVATAGHGRFGKREKSGSRFCWNASRPSCASSRHVVEERGVAGELLHAGQAVDAGVVAGLQQPQRQRGLLEQLARPTQRWSPRAHRAATTALTRPHSSAVAASYWRHSSQTSLARFSPI